MDFQQSHRYLRPPPPPQQPPQPQMSMPPPADPYLHHHHQSHRLPVPPPPPPQNPWYSTQFQYSSSPPPPPHAPPPQHQQWTAAPAPHPHSDHYAQPPPPYAAAPSPYSTAHHPPPPHNQYAPPPPHTHHQLPPLPPRPHVQQPPQIPQSYPQVNQDWGNTNWSHHQSWDYQANTNENVWAERARAWVAAGNVAPDGQQVQHPSYAVNEGSLAGDSVAFYPGRDSSISPSVHQQEVPSSYSSITGEPGRPIAAMPSDYAFAPPAEPSIFYPSAPSVLPSGPQVDPSAGIPSPVPAHPGPIFGGMPGPSFQTTPVSSVNSPFSIGAGPELHPITTFSGDAYGVPCISERPKKASVPNWLREEIIKKKPVIVNFSQESQKEDAQSTEDEGGDKSYGKGDQADSKSITYSRLTEDEDDEEEVETARIAALNQEIKRVLTEVLLKVTDELFDEIATKVINEDDNTPEVDNTAAFSDRKASISTPQPIPTSTASANVLVPVKAQETNSQSDSEDSASSLPVNVLGLASYASEDDEDNEIQSSERLHLKENTLQQQSTSSKFSKGMDVAGNGDLQEDNIDNHTTVDSISSSVVKDIELGKEKAPRVPPHQGSNVSSKMEGELGENELGASFNESKKTLDSKTGLETEEPVEKLVSQKSATDGARSQEARNSSDKNDRHKDERTSSGKYQKTKELDTDKDKANERGNESHDRHDERHKKERRIDENGSRDRVKEKVIKSAEKGRDSDTRKRHSPDYDKEGRRERQTDRRASGKEDSGRKRERTRDDKREKSRHKNDSESSRHKRHRSPSISSRGRDNKDGSTVGGANDSSNESSDTSRRKLHTRRHRSPTVRSKKRQVSPSPHSKHSQRRHSPFSSLETTRGKRSRSRSRSRSPVRRKR